MKPDAQLKRDVTEELQWDPSFKIRIKVGKGGA